MKKKAAKKAVKSGAVAKKQSESAVQPVKKNNLLIVGIIAALVVFVAVEMIYVAKKSAIAAKRPKLVVELGKPYQGFTSMEAYPGGIYITNGEINEVRKIDITNGSIIKIVEIPEGVRVTAEDTAGNAYVLTKNNTMIKLDKTMKRIAEIKIPDVGLASWLEIDSKDTIYVADYNNSTVNKYDLQMNKTGQIGGKDKGKASVKAISKFHVSGKGSIYILDQVDAATSFMRVFASDGKHLNSWQVTNIKRVSYLENFTITPDDYVYFNYFEGSKILVFNPRGKIVCLWEKDVDKRTVVMYPASISGGNTGLLYIAAGKIHVFEPIKF